MKNMYTKCAETQDSIQKLSDQPGHLQNLIRAFAVRLMGS